MILYKGETDEQMISNAYDYLSEGFLHGWGRLEKYVQKDGKKGWAARVDYTRFVLRISLMIGRDRITQQRTVRFPENDYFLTGQGVLIDLKRKYQKELHHPDLELLESLIVRRMGKSIKVRYIDFNGSHYLKVCGLKPKHLMKLSDVISLAEDRLAKGVYK